jgi:tetratricopeptide (TPR) repeat protein
MFRFGVLLQKRQPSFSTKIFRQRLEFCNDSLNGKIHLFIGNNFFADSLVDSAVAEYEAALLIEPGNGYYLTRLAETYSVTGNEPKAREIYQQVVDKGTASGATDADKQAAISAVIKLNGLDVTAKQWGAIVDRCKSALSLDPKNKWLILYMAIGYQGGGSTEDACKWYKELLKVDPANETAKKNTKALGC